MSRVLATAKLSLLRILLRLSPARHHAVVTGFPDDEGNSVEVVRSLARHLPVYWLTEDNEDSVWWLIADADLLFPVTCVRKDSVQAYVRYVTARYVFFTHGLYGSPQPPSHKTFVNLWHGDGPKRSKRFAHVRSTFVVAGTALWGRQRPVYFGVAKDGVLVTGNPRVDQFSRPADDEALRGLGLDPHKRLVLWMPTYRRTEYRGRRLATVLNWSDAPELSESDAERQLFEHVAQLARRLDITVAVKPHPLDADRYAAMGLPVLGREDLDRVQTTVYQLLGRSHGLITDYSSVWTDYLAMDRPIGFHCPDIDEYESTRGLNVEGYRDLLPGPLLESVADFESFLRECLRESAGSRDQRTRSIGLVGAETRPGATDRLLAALSITSSVMSLPPSSLTGATSERGMLRDRAAGVKHVGRRRRYS